jgi:hypothetical protein
MVMALRLSTGLRDALVGTGGQAFGEIMNNGWLDIYTGSQPAHADYPETGTKLVRISSTSGTGVADGCKFGTAASGVLPIIGTPPWSGVVLASGVAGWFRFYGSSGTGGATGTSGTAIRFDGAVGLAGAQLNLTHTDLTLASTLTITGANVTQPEE